MLNTVLDVVTTLAGRKFNSYICSVFFMVLDY